MPKFTHTNFDEFITPHFVSPTVTAAGGNLSNGVANMAGILLRIFNSIFEAIFEAHQRQADRDIAHFLARSGGRLTDDIEREMTQRLLMGSWNSRQ